MSEPPRVLFDMTGVKSRSIFEKIDGMDRRLGPETYTDESLLQILTVGDADFCFLLFWTTVNILSVFVMTDCI